MGFNSWHFVAFFPVVAALYFAVPSRYVLTLLVTASMYFYIANNNLYVLILLASIALDFFVARKMASLGDRRARRPYLVLSLTANLSLLFVFKYYGFASGTLASLGFAELPVLDLILPVGISFYTFQTLSYSVDVYRGAVTPEPHFGRFMLFVSYFPQLVAGPIERSAKLLPQLRQRHAFDAARVTEGLRIMLWGFFKKLVIADQAARLVEPIYGSPVLHSGPTVVLATYFFGVQIFADFSGYCDIAIGASRILGIELSENFRRPYFARSIPEFWHRWHISLSTWFRDYVYIPLGGNRASTGRWAFNVMTVFVVSGLWHGANWTFLAWGALHGAYAVIARFWKPVESKLLGPLPPLARWVVQTFVTFQLVSLAWVFFRARNIRDALLLSERFVLGLPELAAAPLASARSFFSRATIEVPATEVAFLLAAIVIQEAVHLAQERRGARTLGAYPTWFRWAAYHVLIIVIILAAPQTSTFIYFQF